MQNEHPAQSLMFVTEQQINFILLKVSSDQKGKKLFTCFVDFQKAFAASSENLKIKGFVA